MQNTVSEVNVSIGTPEPEDGLHPLLPQTAGNALPAVCYQGFVAARRIGLIDDDAHDCAMDFVLHALMQEESNKQNTAAKRVLRGDLPPEKAALWLRRCARNFALNWGRNQLCRRRHEVTYSDSGLDDEAVFLCSSCGYAASAETTALTRLFRHDVTAACGLLPPASQTLFARFHLHEDSMAEIAYSSGRSPSAIKQSVHRSRAHIKAALVGMGYADYVSVE